MAADALKQVLCMPAACCVVLCSALSDSQLLFLGRDLSQPQHVNVDAPCSHCEPIPEVACRMLFSLIFKGCPRGSEHAVIILKQVIDASCPQPCDASCYAPSEPKYSNKLSSSLDWVPSDSEFLQVRSFPLFPSSRDCSFTVNS